MSLTEAQRHTEWDFDHAEAVINSHAETQRTQSVAQRDMYIAAAWSLGSKKPESFLSVRLRVSV